MMAESGMTNGAETMTAQVMDNHADMLQQRADALRQKAEMLRQGKIQE